MEEQKEMAMTLNQLFLLLELSLVYFLLAASFSSRIIESEILALGISTSITLTSTISPTLTTSRGCSTLFVLLIWEMCTSPSW